MINIATTSTVAATLTKHTDTQGHSRPRLALVLRWLAMVLPGLG